MKHKVPRRIEATLINRSLSTRGGRARMAVLGVAVCTLLVVVLASTMRSVRGSMAAYAGQQAVDLWVAPKGLDNLVRGGIQGALLPDEIAEEIAQLPGVRAAQPILHAFLSVTARRGTETPISASLLAVGFRTPSGLGGPAEYSAGRAPSGSAEVALDRAAAYRLGVVVGDSIDVAGRPLRIVGLTRGTNMLATQFVFGEVDAAAQAVQKPGWASFIPVALAPGANANAVRRAIEERYAYATVFTRDVFAASNDREVMSGFMPLISLIALLGVCAGAVLVGLLVGGIVETRRGDISILLALGASAASVSTAVVLDALSLVAAGVITGTAGAWTLAYLLDRYAPAIPLVSSWSDPLVAAGLFLLTGLLAALIPVARLQRLDPLEAFRP